THLPAGIDTVAAQWLAGKAWDADQIRRHRDAGLRQGKQARIALFSEPTRRVIKLVRDSRHHRFAGDASIIGQGTDK
ncbi:hypothetical protein, partial [Pseudomonas sp. IT-P171]|uniref:hypothetical protein n=1 Tax=Pseudomonas sp. IT-P171 TaxID=3026453 RepID=UPI0039E1AF61